MRKLQSKDGIHGFKLVDGFAFGGEEIIVDGFAGKVRKYPNGTYIVRKIYRKDYAFTRHKSYESVLKRCLTVRQYERLKKESADINNINVVEPVIVKKKPSK